MTDKVHKGAAVVPLRRDASLDEILAAVKGQEAQVVEAEKPTPPVGSSDKATALWYAILNDYELSLTEMLLLEQLANTQTALDEVETAWRYDGAETTALGSTGQVVVEPRIAEMRQLRNQVATLVKALALPMLDGTPTGSQRSTGRRPGRPTRAQNPNQTWN